MAVANPHRQEVVFTVAGNEYACRPTFDVIAKLEARFGSIVQIVQKIATQQIGLADTATILSVIIGKDAPKMGEIGEALIGDVYLMQLAQVANFLGQLLSEPSEQDAGNGEAAAT